MNIGYHVELSEAGSGVNSPRWWATASITPARSNEPGFCSPPTTGSATKICCRCCGCRRLDRLPDQAPLAS